MGSGGGTQTSTGTSVKNLPGWEQEPAKAMVATLMNYIYPNSTVPSNWFSNTGFSFPSGSPLSSQQAGAAQNIQNSALASTLADPTQNALLSPTIAGSTFLQNLAGTNPNAIWGATSPAASSQLAFLYPNLSATGGSPSTYNAAAGLANFGGLGGTGGTGTGVA